MWDRRERGTSLAAIRILLGLVLLGEFLYIQHLDLAVPLFGVEPVGWSTGTRSWIYEILPNTPAGATAFVWILVGLAACFTLGVATPVVTLLLLLFYAESATLNGLSDRAIDRLLRNALLILVFAQAGRTWSLDARLRTGSWTDDRPVPAWPRHLIAYQLILVYFTAGIAKTGASWMPAGDFSALYRVLSDPGTAAFTIPALDALFPLTQMATVGTLMWEISAPIVLLGYWYRHTASRKGWLRRQFNRWHPDRWWLVLGVGFHLGIAIFLSLGIFSWGLLALYPCFLAPRPAPVEAAPEPSG